MPNYLTTEDAMARLEGQNISLSGSQLEHLITRIEEIVNAELQVALGIHEYQEIYKPDHDGTIFLKRYPVQTVKTVELIRLQLLSQSPEAIASREQGDTGNQYLPARFLWDEKSTIFVYSCCGNYRVTYLAGTEIPAMAAETVFEILKIYILNNKTNFQWLHEPIRERTSLSIPGGLSGSYKTSDTGYKTVLQMLIAPLNKQYGRNKFLF